MGSNINLTLVKIFVVKIITSYPSDAWIFETFKVGITIPPYPYAAAKYKAFFKIF